MKNIAENFENGTDNGCYTLLCGVCDHENKIAVTVNEIPVCYDCLRFIENRAKQNGIDKMKQLEIDTSYVALNAT